MQVGRLEEEAVADYVTGRLEEVKQILDDIAYETGMVYVCINADAAEMLGHVGQAMLASLTQIMKIVPGRIQKANDANMIAYAANKKELEEKKKRENGGCDEPGIRDCNTEDGR